MRPAPVVLFALIVLAGPAGAATLTLDAPPQVPVDGSPFEVPVHATGLASGPHELKAWVGGADWQASRTLGPEGWTRGDHYVVPLEPAANGTWHGWVALRANPDGTHHERLAGLASATVGVRLRGPSSLEANATVGVVAAPDHALVALPPGASARATSEATTWRTANPTNATQLVRLAVPPGPTPTLCVAERCTPLHGLRLAASGRSTLALENTGAAPVRLDGVVLVHEGDACLLDGAVPGQARLVVERAALACHDHPAPRGAVWLEDLGTRLDEAPDPPALGWAARVPDTGRWAPWRLPEGTWPTPFERLHVVGASHPFTTREAGLDTVLSVIDGARERLSVATYLFTSTTVAEALERAAHRGVAVRLVLEPTPVGGLPDATEPLVARLEAAGVVVDWATGPARTHGVMHAKLVIADGAVALVLTENLTGSGLNERGDGNVGWGLGIANVTLARRLEALVTDPGPATPWTPSAWGPFDGHVTVVAAPENAWRPEGVPAWLEASTGPVDGLVLRATPTWGERSNPWLSGLVNASARAPVRVLLNGAGEGGWARDGNAAAVGHLAAHPRAGQLTVRSSPAGGPTVHAKALVTDAGVLVGSSNWGLGGALLNREVNLLVEDAAAAAWFQAAFEQAWVEEERGPRMVPGPSAHVAAIIACALGRLAGRKGQRGEPALQGGHR